MAITGPQDLLEGWAALEVLFFTLRSGIRGGPICGLENSWVSGAEDWPVYTLLHRNDVSKAFDRGLVVDCLAK